MSKDKVNITLEKELWDELNRFASEQTIIKGSRYHTIDALRAAVRVFLRLDLSEIVRTLKRDPRRIGHDTLNTG